MSAMAGCMTRGTRRPPCSWSSGFPERTVMGIMGWSSTAMAARYQHVTDPIRRQVADQVGGLLWADESDRSRMAIETGTETKGPVPRCAAGRAFGVCAGQAGGGWGIRTPEGVNPTRFPSVRHRPLGESSVQEI